MSGERVYPDEPADSFPEPPRSFVDREGREMTVRATDPGTEMPEALVEMYVSFDPADRAQGIPPTESGAARRWLETIYAEGYNAVAWHGDVAAGHATLVPDAGGNASNAGAAPRAEAPSAPGVDGSDQPPHELAIFVHQKYQRAGVGSELLSTLLGFAQSRGIEEVWLSVERWNSAAVQLYKTVGFETADTGNFEMEMGIRL
jgi:GNAT superfamily N-acetyltransferase